MRVLVLGGGGFVGSAVCDRLLTDGYQVRIFDRARVTPYREFGANECVDWVRGDFSSRSDLLRATEDVDAVVHLVSFTLPKHSNDDPIFDVQSNVVGTLQLLDVMFARGLRRIVFISSGGTVYGEPRDLPIVESHPTEPLCSYGISKLMIEKHLLLQSRLDRLDPVILRVANPYGARQRVATAQGAVAAFLARALDGKPIEIWGDGRVVRDYLYVNDVAEAFSFALHYNGGHRVFNIASGMGISLNDLVDRIVLATGHNVEVKYLPGRSFDVAVNILDNTLARRHLGWSPRVGLLEGLERTIAGIRGACT